MEYLSFWLLQTLAMLCTAALIPRLTITSLFGAFGTVACLAAVNATVWDAALFMSVPDSFTLHTLTLLLSNGLLFWLLVKILPGIEIQGVLVAIAAPVVFTVLSLHFHSYGSFVDWGGLFTDGLDSIQRLRATLRGAR